MLLQVREADLDLLPHRHLGLVGLVDVDPHEEVVQGRDDHEDVVVVVEISWNGIPLDHDAVDGGQTRHLGLVADRAQLLRDRLIREVADQRVDLVFGNPEYQQLFLGGGEGQPALLLVVPGVDEQLLGDCFLKEQPLAHLEEPEVMLPLDVCGLEVVLGGGQLRTEQIDERTSLVDFLAELGADSFRPAYQTAAGSC